jgi:hypothetical protein
MILGCSLNRANPWRSKIPIISLALHPSDRLQRLARRDFVGIDLDRFLPLGADPASVAHQAHGPEQIALDHERVKTLDALPWVDPVPH